MAYTKQSFTDHVKDTNGNVVQRGTTLKKEHLDHMEDGIFQAHEQLARKLSAPASPQVGDYLRIKSIAADGTMVVEGVPAPEAALPERPTFCDVSLVPQSGQNAGATLVPEGTAERLKVGFYGCHGNEPVELCNVAEATEDESVPNLAQVREMISLATDGTIVPAGTVTLTENGDYDVTQYANAEVAIPEVQQALPEITVNQDTGKIGYTITQEEGYVAGGTRFGTIQQPAQAAKTVTPGVEDKVAVAKGRYVTGDVIVAGDPNLDSKNIRKNVTLFGIPGEAPEEIEAESLNVVHQWEKYSVGEEVIETEKANERLTTKSTGGIGSTAIEFRYADEFKVEDGSIVLVGATITSITDANKSVIVGKYIYVANKGYYRVPADATVTYSTSDYGESIIVSKVYQLSLGEVRTLIGVVLSEDIEAYPADGEQDGYRYVYIGTLEDTGSSGGGAGNDAAYPDWSHLKWHIIGDSLTDRNNNHTVNRYYDFIAQATGIQLSLDGIGGTGYGAGVSTGTHFVERVKNIPDDVDIVTIFGSANDIKYAEGANSEIFHALSWITLNRPGLRVIVVPPAPVKWFERTSEEWTAYGDRLKLCANRCGHRYVADMYDCPPFDPNNEQHMAVFFTTDELGIHPNEAGHKAMAPIIYNALLQELELENGYPRGRAVGDEWEVVAESGTFDSVALVELDCDFSQWRELAVILALKHSKDQAKASICIVKDGAYKAITGGINIRQVGPRPGWAYISPDTGICFYCTGTEWAIATSFGVSSAPTHSPDIRELAETKIVIMAIDSAYGETPSATETISGSVTIKGVRK